MCLETSQLRQTVTPSPAMLGDSKRQGAPVRSFPILGLSTGEGTLDTLKTNLEIQIYRSDFLWADEKFAFKNGQPQTKLLPSLSAINWS